MVTPIEQYDEEQVRTNAKKQISQVERILWWVSIIGVVLIIITIIVFAIHRDYFLWSESFDEEVFGTFGDFVGGFLGTIVAFITMILLIKTLQNQIEVNGNVIITNNNVVNTNNRLVDTSLKQIHQTDAILFDSKFNAYMKAYQDALLSYRQENKVGRVCLDSLVDSYRTEFKSELKYIQRSEDAVKSFGEFYAKNRLPMSVHLRTLYLLMKMINDDANIDENTRVHYAKLVRGQLSESEMFLMRYNSYGSYGQNMKVLVNRFNLLKHLPMMNLLEFRKWREVMNGDEELINSLDAMFLTLKDNMENLMCFDPNTEGERVLRYQLSNRYDIELRYTDDNKKYMFQLFKIVQRGRTGNIRKPAIENALDLLSIDNLRQLFLDFHIDYILVNNFHFFNGKNNGQRKRAKIRSDKRDEKDGVLSVICTVESEYPIILKNSQMENPT